MRSVLEQNIEALAKARDITPGKARALLLTVKTTATVRPVKGH